MIFQSHAPHPASPRVPRVPRPPRVRLRLRGRPLREHVPHHHRLRGRRGVHRWAVHAARRRRWRADHGRQHGDGRAAADAPLARDRAGRSGDHERRWRDGDGGLRPRSELERRHHQPRADRLLVDRVDRHRRHRLHRWGVHRERSGGRRGDDLRRRPRHDDVDHDHRERRAQRARRRSPGRRGDALRHRTPATSTASPSPRRARCCADT